MKTFILAIGLILCSCGVPLKDDGTFGEEQFIGKFHGLSIYRVMTPEGTALYIGVSDDGNTVMTDYTTSNGKGATQHHRVITHKEAHPHD